MPLCLALAEVELQLSLFDSIAIKYCHQDPLSWDIVIACPHLGFHLCFDSRLQVLLLNILDEHKLCFN